MPSTRGATLREAAIDMLSDTAAREAAARRSRLIGIALMCGAVGTFACLDTTAKYLGREIAVMQIVWARYTIAFVLTLPISNPLRRPGLLRTRRPMLQIGRATLLVGSTVLNFLALRWLQLDEVLSIIFTIPFIVPSLSGPMLGEWIGWRRWSAIAVGLVGVLVITRPGFGDIHPAALLAHAVGLLLRAVFPVTRIVSRTDSNETTLFYSNVVGAVVMLPVIPFVWTAPTLGQFALLVMAGVLASFGHYFLIVAHRLAPPSLLSPFIYTQLVWVVVLGYVVFDDVPDSWTLFGASIVVGSGLYILYRERMSGPRRRKAPETAVETGD